MLIGALMGKMACTPIPSVKATVKKRPEVSLTVRVNETLRDGVTNIKKTYIHTVMFQKITTCKDMV